MKVERNEFVNAIETIQHFLGRTTDYTYRYVTIDPRADKTVFFGFDGNMFCWYVLDKKADIPTVHLDLDSAAAIAKACTTAEIELEYRDKYMIMNSGKRKSRLKVHTDAESYDLNIPNMINVKASTDDFLLAADIGSLASPKDGSDEIGIIVTATNGKVTFISAKDTIITSASIDASIKEEIGIIMPYHSVRHMLKTLKRSTVKSNRIIIRSDKEHVFMDCGFTGFVVPRLKTKGLNKEIAKRMNAVIKKPKVFVNVKGPELSKAVESAAKMERDAHGSSILLSDGTLKLITANSVYDSVYEITEFPEDFRCKLKAADLKSFIKRTISENYSIGTTDDSVWIMPTDKIGSMLIAKEIQ